jgi:serine protease AprX
MWVVMTRDMRESRVPLQRAAIVSVLAVLASAGPITALAAPAGASAAPSGRDVRAVVSVHNSADLPVRVPGGRVLEVLRAVGAEVVTAPASSYAALSRDPRVAGIAPDARGHVTGWRDRSPAHSSHVLAAQQVGGSAGEPGTGAGVTVALLDTGVSDTPALNRASGRLVDGVDVSRLAAGGPALTSGQFTDGYGHGTMMASLIAGGVVPGSGSRALGIAPAAHVVVVKVADANGVTSLSEVLAGLDWVAVNAPHIGVVNLSLAIDRPTGPRYGSDPLTAGVEHVRAAGVLAVASSGNTASQVGDPGDDPQSLTVGATDLDGHGGRGRDAADVASFSGRGIVDGVVKPDVVAPGAHVLGQVAPDSVIAQQNPTATTPEGLFVGSGTSEATAVTSGAAAAYLSSHPGSSPAQVKTGVRTSASPLCTWGSGAGSVTAGTDSRSGHGRGGRGCGRWNRSGVDVSADPSGEASFDAARWRANSWLGGAWIDLLASSWSASSWSASSWSASSWSASSWSASSWSASSWSASSWSASSWSDESWGDAG